MQDGLRRFGKPRTDEERRRRHRRLYGAEKFPPRGTGLGRRRLLGRNV